MLTTVFFPYSDRNMPSSYYRVYLMESELRKRGIPARIIPPNLSDAQKRIELDSLTQRSIIYIQKTGNSFHIPENFLPYRDKHILIFDIDDYIDSPLMEAMIGCAHAVICGSHFLFDYARLCTSRAYLLPCSIDETMFSAPRHRLDGPVRVVWSHCFADAYADDLLSIAGPLRNVYARHPFELILCGFRNHDNGSAKRKVQDAMPFATCIDYQPLEQFARKTAPLIQQADIALVPFVDSIDRRSKAGLTLRNYMAMGIPAVASPVGEHCHILTHRENGFAASCPSDWEQYLTLLLADKELRASTGQHAQESVLKRYSAVATADKLEKIIREVSGIDTQPVSAVTHRHEKNCAVVLGRIDNTGGYNIAQETIEGIPVLYYIGKMLKNTGMIERVIYAMPDDPAHRKFAKSMRSEDIEIKLGDRDTPAKRVYESCPDDCTTVFKFVIEKPFADSQTLAHIALLLRTRADIVKVHDPSWGIACEGLSRKAVIAGKQQVTNSLRHCDGFFMGKPMFEPVSVALDTFRQAALYREYIATDSDCSVERFQQFAAVKNEHDKATYYTAVKDNRIAPPDGRNAVCLVLDASCDHGTIKKFLQKTGCDETVMCVHHDFPVDAIANSPFLRLSTRADVPLDELDIAVEQGYRFTEQYTTAVVYSLSDTTAVYAVRLANRRSCPVYCYLSGSVDPADRILKHHLATADGVYTNLDEMPCPAVKRTALS